MDLEPWVFWKLTPQEFQHKHNGFMRREGREISNILRLAVLTTSYKPGDAKKLAQTANDLRRYPIKSWLKSPSP